MTPALRSTNLALIAIVAEGFLSRLSFALISFALPLYAYHLGMKLSEIGILSSINLIVALPLKPAMGVVADRFGLKRSFAAATSLRSVVSFAFGFVSAPWQLLTVRSVYGVSQSLRDPALNALLAEHGGQKRIAAAFGWYSTGRRDPARADGLQLSARVRRRVRPVDPACLHCRVFRPGGQRIP